MDRAELVLDCRNQHGEGVLWNPVDRRVWWTDIEGRALWSLDPESGSSERLEMPDRVCCFAPRAGGGFIVAFAKSIEFYDAATGDRALISHSSPKIPRRVSMTGGPTGRAGWWRAG
jgi:L-arabinonolactonase